MPDHKYTSLRDLLDASQRRTRFASNANRFPLANEMFGELWFRKRSSRSVRDLFSSPLPRRQPLPKSPLHDHGEVLGSNGSSSRNPDTEEEKKTKVKKNLAQNNLCKSGNSGQLFPPPLSTLQMNRGGEPFVYQQFDEGKNAFVPKQMLLPHQIMATTRADGRLRMNFACDFADAEKVEEAAEEQKVKSSENEAEEEVAPVVAANVVKSEGKP